MAGVLNAIEISSRGLTTQRMKMDVVAQNMANVETTQGPDGQPYHRKRVIVKEEAMASQKFNSYLRKSQEDLVRTHPEHRPGLALEIKQTTELSSAAPKEVQDKDAHFKLVYDPSHPQADAEGYVKYPDVDIITEMVDMMTATRAYEANTVSIADAKKNTLDALDI
mgnify:CR=1 FL=1